MFSTRSASSVLQVRISPSTNRNLPGSDRLRTALLALLSASVRAAIFIELYSLKLTLCFHMHLYIRRVLVLYGFSISYVLFPLAGLPFSSTDIIEVVSTLPESVKYAGKAILAFPFAFHSWNGLRHLAWDSGKCTSDLSYSMKSFSNTKYIFFPAVLSLKGAYASGYAVLGATAVTTIGLLFI